jgi:hypothetical protein
MITHEAMTVSAWLFAPKLHHLLSGGSVPEKTLLLISNRFPLDSVSLILTSLLLLLKMQLSTFIP